MPGLIGLGHVVSRYAMLGHVRICYVRLCQFRTG